MDLSMEVVREYIKWQLTLWRALANRAHDDEKINMYEKNQKIIFIKYENGSADKKFEIFSVHSFMSMYICPVADCLI